MPNTNSSQPNSTTRARQRADRYRRLLDLRVDLGCRVIDALVHGEHDGLSHLYAQCNELDEMLERQAKYRRDYPEIVLVVEDGRYHEAGRTLPRDSRTRPCAWCRRGVSLVPANVALPALRDAA